LSAAADSFAGYKKQVAKATSKAHIDPIISGFTKSFSDFRGEIAVANAPKPGRTSSTVEFQDSIQSEPEP
jgi:hypothetical protein